MAELKILVSPAIQELQDTDPALTLIINPGDLANTYKSIGYLYLADLSNPEDPDELSKATESFQKAIDAYGHTLAYGIEKASYTQEVIQSKRPEVGDASAALNLLLNAAETNNIEEIVTVLKYNFSTLQTASKTLLTLLDTVCKDEMWELKAHKALVQVNEYKKKLTELTTELSTLRTHASIAEKAVKLEDELRDAENKCSELNSTVADLTRQLTLRPTVKELDDLKEAYAKLEDDIDAMSVKDNASQTELFTEESIAAKDLLIAKLKEDLKTVSQSQRSTITDETLPLLNGSIPLKAGIVKYFKELKTAPYLEGLVSWMALSANSRRRAQAGNKEMIIIIYDRMDNEYILDYYTEAGFNINSGPTPQSKVIVTNDLSINFLRNVVNVSHYPEVVVIDRLGFKKDIVTLPNMKYFYLINNIGDLETYKIPAESAVAYFDSNGVCSKEILPDATYGAKDDPSAKMFLIHKLNWLQELFKL